MDQLVALRSAVRASLQRYEAGDLILVAVSGGADSLALAAALKLEADKVALRLKAITIDHQLQAGSANQADRVLAQLANLEIECTIIKVDVVVTDGVESSARRARYEAFEKYARESNARALYLGHTRDDQAETVLMGLARGSGARSLSAMAAENGIYIRPFLNITRTQTLAACEELKLVPWMDPHNKDKSFLRVRVREDILPLMEQKMGPGISDALARSADLLRDDADALDFLAKQFWSEDKSLEVESLLKLPKAIRTRVLRLAAFESGVTQLSADQVGAMEALISDWRGQGVVSLPAGVKVSRISGRLTLSK